MSDTAFLERRRARYSGPRSGSSSCGARGKPGEARSPQWLATGLEVAPIRIPVTRENQEVLRQLRARELALWEGAAADRAAGQPTRVEMPREDRESQLILLLLGGAALGLWLQAATAAVRFVEGWETFRGWVSAVLG